MSGFIHNDVKPANLLIGAKGSMEEQQQLHLIDFGLTTRRDDTAPPDAPGDKSARVGTPMYASIAAHEGRVTRPVDDVEALVYCLAFLASGGLPWQHKPHSRALFIKRRMLTDGCEVMTDSCAAHDLTEEVQSDETAGALQALWAIVVEAHETGEELDYGACRQALGGPAWDGEGAMEEPRYAWEG